MRSACVPAGSSADCLSNAGAAGGEDAGRGRVENGESAAHFFGSTTSGGGGRSAAAAGRSSSPAGGCSCDRRGPSLRSSTRDRSGSGRRRRAASAGTRAPSPTTLIVGSRADPPNAGMPLGRPCEIVSKICSGLEAVDPLVVHQRRAHAPAAVGVAADAVERGEQPLPLREGVGVVLVVFGVAAQRPPNGGLGR